MSNLSFVLGIKVIGLMIVTIILFSTSVTAAGQTIPTFQSTNEDSFRVHVPEGWIIQDVDNTGSALEAEVREGFGILAQLCPEGQRRAQSPIPPNVGGSSCQGAQEEVIHIIRYLNLRYW